MDEVAEALSTMTLAMYAITRAIARQPGIDAAQLRADLAVELREMPPANPAAFHATLVKAILSAADFRDAGA